MDMRDTTYRFNAVKESFERWRDEVRPGTDDLAHSSFLRAIRHEDNGPKVPARAPQSVSEVLPLLHCVPQVEAGARLVGSVPYRTNSRDRGGFVQRLDLEPGGLILAARVDIRLAHDPNTVFGRAEGGALRVFEDHAGLKFSFTSRRWDPLTDLAFFLVDRRSWAECSLGFYPLKEFWQVAQSPKEIDLRIFRRVEVFEISVLSYAAWPSRVCIARKEQEAKTTQSDRRDGRYAAEAVRCWGARQPAERRTAGVVTCEPR